MAPFDNPPSSSLKTKISPLIEGQLPDFVRDDHPLFTKFIEYYYQYLEAAELVIVAQVDNVIQETFDVQYILDEDDNQIVYEDSEGKFTVGETITGSKSKATATILIDDQRNNRLFITSAQQFVTDEVIVGATSGSEGTITRYRGNPVQNIQQLLDYADADRTISDFLDQLAVSFMNAIPKRLVGWNPQGTADETVNRRSLIKNIRELYRLKGTSESFKLFIRILLNLDSEVIYPRKFMMRPSDGNYERNIILRTTAISSAVGDELEGQKLTGLTSGATAIVGQSNTLIQGAVDITEFIVGNKVGDFVAGETVQGVSRTRNVLQDFTVFNIVSKATVTNDGILYSAKDKVTISTDFGNKSALAEIESVKTGSVSSIFIDDAGAGYKVGDPLVFASSESKVALPAGFVSVVDGAIALDGTDDSSTDAGDYLVYEDGTTEHLESFDIALEPELGDEATAIINGLVDNSTILLLDNNVGTITDSMIVYGAGLKGITIESITSQNQITINKKVSLPDDTPIRFAESAGILRLETGNDTATDMGHNIISELGQTPVADTYTTGADQMQLEEATIPASETSGVITRIFLTNHGNGMAELPTVTLNPSRGTKILDEDGTYDDPATALIYATTTDIGGIDEILITDSGADYSTTEPPDITPRANFVLKDVSGTFVVGEALTTHTGIVQSYNSERQLLETTIEDVVRTTLETTDALPIGLEDSLGSIESYVTLSGGGTDDGFYDEGFPHTGIADETNGNPIILNATELTGDAFIELEDDTKGILRTEPNSFIPKTLITLEDESGVIVGEDAEEITKKFITQFPRGRQPARTWLDQVDFIQGRKLSETEFEPPRITPTSHYLDNQSWQNTFGVYVPTLTHKANATAIVNGITATQTVTLDNNSGTIDEQMFVTGTIATATISGSTVKKYDVRVVVTSGTIQKGLVVEGTGIPVGTLVSSVTTAQEFTLNTQVSLSDEAVLTFKLPPKILVTDVTSQTSITISTFADGAPITLSDDTSLSFESPSTNGPFVKGEEITGGTTGGKALILDPSGDTKFISSNGIDFEVGETITGESKLDTDGNAVNATAVIQTLGQAFIISPESIWTEFKVETITEKNAPLLEDASCDIIFSKESEEIVLESAGPFRDFAVGVNHLILDGTDTTINVSGSGFSSERTDAGGFIIEEDSGDIIILEEDGDNFTTRFSEQSTFDFYDGQNFGVILDGDFDDTGKILLDGTDTDGTNAGSEIIDESSNAGGTGSSGVIELEEGGVLLGEIEAETGVVALNGFDSSSTHAGSSVIHDVDGIDFSAGTTVITASGGFSGTIVGADVAKATTTVATDRTEIIGYGSDISSILGEDLNRLQDSVFYQQFSYEIQSGAGVNYYIDELTKAVHPSGFAVFGKTKIAQQLETAMVLNSKPMTISSFVGDQPIQVKRALAAFNMQQGSFMDVFVQEDSLSTGVTEFLSLDGTDGSSSNAGDSILQESATAGTTTNNLILDATDFNESDHRGDILLDGTDSDATDAGDSLELEDELHEPKNKIVFERIDNPNGINHNALIKEDGSFLVPETSPTSGSGRLRVGETTDVSVINSMSLKLATNPSAGPSQASLGLVGLATPFGGADSLETELGTIRSKAAQEAHHRRRIGIIPTFFPLDIRQEGQLLSEDGGQGPVLSDVSTFPLSDFVRTGVIDIGEDATNTNVTSETVGVLLEQTETGSFKQEDGTTVAGTHGDDILLENATGPNLNEKLLLESLRIELEDSTSKSGVVPFQNFGENTFDNIAISSDILSDEGLGIALEDNSGPDHILLDGTDDNSQNAGFFLIDESELEFKMLFESVETGHADNTGVIIFNGTDSDSSNSGDKVIFQLATRSDLLNNSAYDVEGIPDFSSRLITMDNDDFEFSNV